MNNTNKKDTKQFDESKKISYQKELLKTEKYKNIVKKIFHIISPLCRKYDMEIFGLDNIDFSDSKIFVSNHSNSHDFYTIQEVFKNMIHILAASDSLDNFTQFLFKISGVEMIDRRDKKSCKDGINNMVKYLMNGENVIILPEGTWNIHPSKPMLPMKHGAALVSKMSKKPIIPVVFEYLENNNICKKEKDIYEKCIVKFLEPIYVKEDDDLTKVTQLIRDEMATARWEIWEEQGIVDRSEIDPLLMKNHNDLKVKSDIFEYNNEYELQFILGSKNPIYNEYPMNGITYDEKGKQLIKK